MRDKREVRAAWRRPRTSSQLSRGSQRRQATPFARLIAGFRSASAMLGGPQVHFALRPQAFCQLKLTEKENRVTVPAVTQRAPGSLADADYHKSSAFGPRCWLPGQSK